MVDFDCFLEGAFIVHTAFAETLRATVSGCVVHVLKAAAVRAEIARDKS